MSDIYIKPKKKVSIEGKDSVLIKDIADVVVSGESVNLAKINTIKILRPDTSKKGTYLVSVTDIIKAINTSVPGSVVNNVGEMDTVINYSPVGKVDNFVWKWMKIAFVAVVLAAGSATAIMSFHTDAQIPSIFKNFYYIFFNEYVDNPLIIELPYSIGVAVGIVVFFNHFAGKKLTSDPTPIQVEIAVYDGEVTDAVTSALQEEEEAAKAKEEGKR